MCVDFMQGFFGGCRYRDDLRVNVVVTNEQAHHEHLTFEKGPFSKTSVLVTMFGAILVPIMAVCNTIRHQNAKHGFH